MLVQYRYPPERREYLCYMFFVLAVKPDLNLQLPAVSPTQGKSQRQDKEADEKGRSSSCEPSLARACIGS